MTTLQADQTFTSLHGQYEKLVLAICSRSLRGHQAHIEDCAQTTWLKAWQAVQTGQSINKAWLSTVAQNAAMDLRERLNLRPEQSLDEMIEQQDEEGNSTLDTHPGLAGQITDTHPFRSEALRAAIDQLSPALRETIEERYFESLSVKEISQRHGIPSSTVTRRLTDARNALKAFITGSSDRKAA